jgi:cytochrome P450
VLRLYAPTNIIPKGTVLDKPQTIFSADHEFTVPGNTAFQIVVSSTHRNPKYWPSGPAPLGKTDDLEEFRPQRWLKKESPAVAKSPNEDKSDIRQPEEMLSSDTSDALFRPFPGSYIPFSTGHRRCIGRRFAQVELLAVLAVLLKSYTLEIDVENFADDEAIKLMSAEKKEAVWVKAAAKLKFVLREGMRHHLTMQHKEGKIALRLVKRGEERFL